MNLRRAAITVEASYIIPWAVIILALLITMTFYVHNRVWYTAAACETALSGNRYVEGSGGTGQAGYAGGSDSENVTGNRYAEQTLQHRIQDQAMPGSEPENQITCMRDATEVTLSGQDFSMFSDVFSWSVEEKVKKIRPVKIIRDKWVVAGVVNSLGMSMP